MATKELTKSELKLKKSNPKRFKKLMELRERRRGKRKIVPEKKVAKKKKELKTHISKGKAATIPHGTGKGTLGGAKINALLRNLESREDDIRSSEELGFLPPKKKVVKKKKPVKKIISSATKKDKRFTKKIPVIRGPKATKRKPISEVDMYPKEKRKTGPQKRKATLNKLTESGREREKRIKRGKVRYAISPTGPIKEKKPIPRRKPIGDYITDVRPKPQLGAGTEFAVKPRKPKKEKPWIEPEDDLEIINTVRSETKSEKDKPFWESLFGSKNVDYTYPEEINDKKGGYLKKDLKKAKARRRAAIRGHRKELRGG
jgi:hypothetical protein|tara:strand:+ start:1406 stop:2353 length:948 start_codon:yes stop_codon:yes gene_type:complete